MHQPYAFRFRPIFYCFLLLILTLVLPTGRVRGQAGNLNTFAYTPGGALGQPVGLLPTAGSGYLLAGYTRFGYDSSYVALTQLSAALDVRRHVVRRLNTPLNFLNTLADVPGGWLLGGVASPSFGSNQPYLVFTDTTLAPVWARWFDNLRHSQTQIVQVLAQDRASFVAFSYADGFFDGAFYRLTGDLAGTRFRGREVTLTGGSTDRLRVYNAAATGRASEHLVVGGYQNTTGDRDLLILKMDSSRVRWSQRLDFGNAAEEAYQVLPTADGHLLTSVVNYGVAGSIYPSVLVKLDTAGTVRWSRRLTLAGQSLFLPLVAETTTGDIIAAGLDAGYNLIVVKLSATGTLLWGARGNGLSIPQRLLRAADGTFLVCGAGYQLAHFDADGNGCLTRLASADLTVTNATPTITPVSFQTAVFTPTTQVLPLLPRTQTLTRSVVCVATGLPAEALPGPVPRLEAVPNPASGSTRLTGLRPGEPVTLLNVLGRPVRQYFPRTTPAAELDLHGLTPGLYLLQVGRRVARLVVE